MKSKLALLLLCTFFFSCVHSIPIKSFSFTQKHMGTDFRIILYAPSDKMAQKASLKAFERIAEIDQTCSDYIAESELSRLSRTHNEWIPLSNDLWNVLSYAQELAAQSNGAFDITCGALTLPWRIARYRKKLPSEETLQRALSRVGYQKLLLDSKTQSAKLVQSGMRLDLGALAKGYAADQALISLKNEGVKFALIDASGDMLMTKHPFDSWKIFINDHNNSSHASHLKLQAAAIATSGDAIQHLKIDSTKHSHIIDPRTGHALTQSSRVTIISSSAMEADALASTLSVLGAQKGIQFLKKLDSNAVLISQNNETFKTNNFPTIHDSERLYD